jgi:hypothetical protein
MSKSIMKRSANGGRDPETGQFTKGWKATPGRPRGSKDKLQRDFVEALTDDFAQRGIEAIERVRTEDPASYLRIIAQILPRDMNLNHDAVASASAFFARVKQRYDGLIDCSVADQFEDDPDDA